MGNIYDGTGARLSFGSTDGAYIQEPEYADNKLEIYSNNSITLTGGSTYFGVGLKTSSPSTLLDVGGGNRTQVSPTGKNILVAGDAEIDNNLYVEGNTFVYGTLRPYGTLDWSDKPAKVKIFDQATMPTTTDIPFGTTAFWHDSTNNKYYQIVNFGGTLKKVEML